MHLRRSSARRERGSASAPTPLIRSRNEGTEWRGCCAGRSSPSSRPEHALARTLSWPHLVALGRRRDRRHRHPDADRRRRRPRRAGGASCRFAIAGAICACAALAYAEMATMIPASGSAYTYSYVVLGEIIAWVVGWSLILEYSLVVATVAVGWSGYARRLPERRRHRSARRADARPELANGALTTSGSTCPAMFIIAVVAALLCARHQARARRINAVLVVVKIVALARVRRGRAAAFRRRQPPPVRALRLRQGASRRTGWSAG